MLTVAPKSDPNDADELIERDGLRLAESFVLPVVSGEPGVQAAKGGRLGLLKQSGAARTAKRNPTLLERLNQGRRRRTNRSKEDSHVLVSIALGVQSFNGARDCLSLVVLRVRGPRQDFQLSVRSERLHGLIESRRDRLGERVGGGENCRARPPIDAERALDSVVSVLERQDVVAHPSRATGRSPGRHLRPRTLAPAGWPSRR